MTYSHMGTPTLPSAILRFTSEFDMGSGGTTALLSLGKLVEDAAQFVDRLLFVCTAESNVSALNITNK